jgi:hypothetical protein
VAGPTPAQVPQDAHLGAVVDVLGDHHGDEVGGRDQLAPVGGPQLERGAVVEPVDRGEEAVLGRSQPRQPAGPVARQLVVPDPRLRGTEGP